MNEQQLQQAYTRHCETTGQTKTTRTGFEDFKAGFRLAQPAAGEPAVNTEVIRRELGDILREVSSGSRKVSDAYYDRQQLAPEVEAVQADLDSSIRSATERLVRIVVQAPPAAAPVAAGEPVAFADELISGALQGGDFSGADIQELAVKHGLLCEERREEPCRDEGCACAEHGFPTECYRKTAALAPPAAAHGDEAVRKDAERYRLLRRKVAIVGTERKAEFCILNLEPVHIAPNPSIEFDAAIDAAMRAQGDGEVQ